MKPVIEYCELGRKKYYRIIDPKYPSTNFYIEGKRVVLEKISLKERKKEHENITNSFYQTNLRLYTILTENYVEKYFHNALLPPELSEFICRKGIYFPLPKHIRVSEKFKDYTLSAEPDQPGLEEIIFEEDSGSYVLEDSDEYDIEDQ